MAAGPWDGSGGCGVKLRTLVKLVREDAARHGDWRRPGARALIMYRFGAWRADLRWSALKKGLWPVYALLYRHVRDRYRIEVHYTARIGRRVRLADQGDIVLGNWVTIGDDCVIGPHVTLGKASEKSVGWPQLGSAVVVEPGAVIIGDITVGNGAHIGPNAVVTASVPDAATVSVEPPRVRPRRGRQDAEPTAGG